MWHIDELDEAFRSYLATIQFEHHPEFPNTPWKMKIEDNPLSASLPVILGEAVQNMRTALDYLVYELALHSLSGKKLRARTQFPIATTATSYFKTGRKQVWPLLGEHRRRIRKLQPYQFSGDPNSTALATLNRLSNTDKHRLLLTVTRMIGSLSFNLINQGGNVRIVGTECIALPIYIQGTEAAEEARSGYPDLGGTAWFDLGIAEEDVGAFDALNQLLGTVTEIIDGFVPVFGKE